MAFCSKCGEFMEDTADFCSKCGAPAAGKVNIDGFDQYDISRNTVMAVLSYISILVLVPIFAAKNSKYARFHANQGLVLFIISFAWGIISSVATGLLKVILPSFISAPVISLLSLITLLLLVLHVLGIINAATGKTKPIPVIGQIKIL